MPVAHTPLIAHTMQWLSGAGVSRITVCSNDSWRVGRDLLHHAGLPSVHVTHYIDGAPRGAAGCVRDAADQFGGERFVVCDGTILPDCDLGAILKHHEQSRAVLTVVVTRERQIQDGQAQRLGPVGIYVVERSALEDVPTNGYQDLKEMLVPRLYARGAAVTTCLVRHTCLRVVGVESYLKMCATAAVRLARQKMIWPGYQRVGDAYLHESADVDATDRLVGPVLVGPGTRIERGVTVVGPTTIGRDCLIRSSAVICSSVLWDGCMVDERAVVDHAVASDGAHVPAGQRLDHTLLPGDRSAAPRPKNLGEPLTLGRAPAAEILRGTTR